MTRREWQRQVRRAALNPKSGAKKRTIKAKGRAADLRPLVSFDNHRSARFGAPLRDDIPEVVTAEQMWERYQALAKKAEEALRHCVPHKEFLEAFNYLSSNNIQELPHSLPYSHRGDRIIFYIDDQHDFASASALRHNFDQTQIIDFAKTGITGGSTTRAHSYGMSGDVWEQTLKMPRLTPEMVKMMKDLFDQYKARMSAPPQEEPETASWRLVNPADKIDPLMQSWEAMQATMPPNPRLDEDVLYNSLEGLILSLPEKVKYVMLGDTNHCDEDLVAYRSYDLQPTLKLLYEQGFIHGVAEFHTAFQPPVDQFIAGTLSKKELAATLHNIFKHAPNSEQRDARAVQYAVDRMVTQAAAAKETAGKIHYLDEQLFDANTEEHDRFRHEQGMAARIKASIGDEKAWIQYGAGHFWYQQWMIDHLGRDKSVVIDMHADYESYLAYNKKYPASADYQPDYIFLAKEQLVIAPRPKDARSCAWQRDGTLTATRECLQDSETEKFRARVAAEGSALVTADDVLADMRPYWQRDLLRPVGGVYGPSFPEF